MAGGGERWHMLAIYALSNFVNAFIWLTFASIDTEVADYYRVSTTWVNMLSTVFLVLYIPGTIMNAILLSRYGLRRALVVGAALDLSGTLLRALSTSLVAHDSGLAYAALLLGQCVAGIAQPIFVNTAAKLAGDWFSPAERDTATVLSVLANPVGNAAGQVVPTLFVSSLADTEAGMPRLLWGQAGVCALCFVWTVGAFRSRPDEAPSATAAARQARAETSRADGDSSSALWELWDEYRELLRNRDFLVLLVAFGYGLGVFNALLTVLEQLVRPSGYSTDDAGEFGGVLLAAGLVGSAVMGVALDKTHKYNELLRVGFGGGVFAVAFLMLNLRPDSALVLPSFALAGLFLLPMLPVSIECAVECSYPVTEAASSSLLIIVGNLWGVVLIFVLQYLAELRTGYHGVFTSAAWFLVGSVLFCFVSVCFYNGRYRRLEAERAPAGRSPLQSPLLVNSV